MNLFNLFYGKTVHENEQQRNPKGIMIVPAVVKWHFGRLIWLNVLFLLSCIPIVTIPCAISALCRVELLMLQRRPYYLWHDYWQAFHKEWKRSISAIGLCMLVSVFTAFAVWFYPRHMHNILGTIFSACCLVICILALVMLAIVPPMVVLTDLSVFQIVKNSVLLLFIKLPITLLIMLLAVIYFSVIYFTLPFSVIYTLLFQFSFFTLLTNYFSLSMINEVIIERT